MQSAGEDGEHDITINFDGLDFLCVVMELGQFELKQLFDGVMD